MGGFVLKRGQVQRITLTREQLTEIAKILNISAPDQVRSVSVAINQRPPSKERPANKPK